MISRKAVDWVAIRTAHGKSEESVREIAGRHKVSHVAILKRAREEGWGERPAHARKAPPKAGNQKAGNQAIGNGPAVTQRGNHAGGNWAAKRKPPEGKILAVIREWQKNWMEIGRVTLEEYNGAILIQVRSWTRDPRTGVLKPTRKGVAVTIDQVVAEVLPALNDALAKARDLGLFDEGEADQ